MKKLIVNLIVGFSAVYLASLYLPGVSIDEQPFGRIQVIAIVGIVLGLVNYFLRPIVNLITLPLRILTFGLFGLIINMAMVFLVDMVMPYLAIEGIWPYFYIGLIVWVLNLLVSKIIH